MDFEIRHQSATILKPVVNAAARTLDHARVELGPGAIRIWGNDKKNTAAIDMRIPADAFDTYEVEPGTFETNIDRWNDALRGTRKTDPVAVYTEPNDFDSITDLHSVGSSAKRVLRDKGLDSIEALESAMPEELVGETEYKRGSNMQTAEIDREKAEGILFELEGSHVVIESDGERQFDPDEDHPRQRKPRFNFQMPDREVGGTATVNGRDFSKGVRAISKVTDETAFLGITEGSFVLYGEGDTDEVHSNPTAETSGTEAAGIYNPDWLSTLRLSMDRKASTDLTISLPSATGASGETPNVMWADYEISTDDGAVEVTWALAPKIRTSENPETNVEQLERVAPSNYDAAENVRWDGQTTGGVAKSWFAVLDSKADELRLTIGPDAISTRFVEAANVMMQDVEIPDTAWDSYTWRQPAGQLYEQDRVIGLPQARVSDYLKLVTKTEDVRFQVDENAQFIISGDYFTATVATIDPDSVRQEPDLPGLDLPGTATVDTESFKSAVEEADDVADHVGLVMYDGEFYVHADGDLGDTWQSVETVAGEGYASSLYSADYLTDYLDSIEGDATDRIQMYAGREFPIFAEHSVEHPDTDFMLMLAPRRQQDVDLHGTEAMKEHGLDPLKVKEAEPIFSVGEDGYVVRDEPGESRPQTPEEVADSRTEDDGGDVYDPTDEYGPTMDTAIPTSELMAGIEGTGLAPSDLTREQHVTLDGDTYHQDDADDPDERERFRETMAGVYDPTEELEEDDRVFRVTNLHKTKVPEQIGDWELKTQVDEGRPVYTKDGKELRINRSFSTDVIHRRYYVELRGSELKDTGVKDREQIATDLSPEGAMEALKEAARERSADSADGGVYDPTDEFEELEEPSGISAIGAGRRKTLDAIDTKDTLDDVQTFNSLEEMLNAVREISLAQRDGRTYLAPPEKALNAIEGVYEQLPEEAQKPFLNDDTLHRRINAARKAFNRWTGKKQREQKMPSPVEAGPSNYPAKKARETSRYAREGMDELKERISKIASGARGAKQRALNAIGSSVAEQNAKEAQSKTEKMREKLEPGDVVLYFSTTSNWDPWGVKRVNKKSVRLKRPHPNAGGSKPMSDDQYPEYELTTVDLDSKWLRYLEPSEVSRIAEIRREKANGDVEDAHHFDTRESALRHLMGAEWVDDNLDLATAEESSPDEDSGDGEADESNPAANEDGDLADTLREMGVNNIVASNLARQHDSIESVREAVESADDVTDLKGVGDGSARQVREAFDLGSQTVAATDPETGETDVADVPPGTNGWVRQDDAPPTRGAAVWQNPNAADPVDYLHVTKTGPNAYLVQRNTGEKGDYDRENVATLNSMDSAVERATDYMEGHPAEGGSSDRDDEHQRAVEAARDADPDGDLPGPALQALKKNWGIYKRGIKEGREAVEEAEEYRDEHRGDAEEAAAIINDIRAAYGQDPIDFEGVDGVPEVPELGGPITEENSSASLSFDWRADPYDPTEEA